MSRWQFLFVGAVILSFSMAVGRGGGQVRQDRARRDRQGARDRRRLRRRRGQGVVAKDEANKARQWKLEKDGDHYKIVNRKSTKVLDVNNQSKDEGGSIIQWEGQVGR